MNPAKYQYATLFQSFQSGGHQFTGGSEDNCCIEFRRGFLGGFAGPHSPQLQGELLMLCASRAGIYFDSPMPRHLDCHMRGCTKTVEGQPAAALHSREPQRPKPDDSRTEKRGCLLVRK